MHVHVQCINLYYKQQCLDCMYIFMYMYMYTCIVPCKSYMCHYYCCESM